jgi:ABC-type glucose/galactose transport system permease subunit
MRCYDFAVLRACDDGAAFTSAVSYLPFGPVNQISFANGKTLTKNYDQNYDIDAIVSTATGGLNLDNSVDEVGNIVGVCQKPKCEVSF